jgi:hypothetical protein
MVTNATKSQEDQTVRQYRYLLRTAPLVTSGERRHPGVLMGRV